MKVVLIVIVLLVFLFLGRSVTEKFSEVLFSPPVDPSSINVQRPASEILQELAQIPDRYTEFFGIYNKSSSKKNQKYPLLWPLTAGDLDQRLAFSHKIYDNGGNTYKKFIVTNSVLGTPLPPTTEMIWFTGEPGLPGNCDAQLRAYDPQKSADTNNFFDRWIYGVRASNPNVPYFGGSPG